MNRRTASGQPLRWITSVILVAAAAGVAFVYHHHAHELIEVELPRVQVNEKNEELVERLLAMSTAVPDSHRLLSNHATTYFGHLHVHVAGDKVYVKGLRAQQWQEVGEFDRKTPPRYSPYINSCHILLTSDTDGWGTPRKRALIDELSPCVWYRISIVTQRKKAI